MKLKYFCLILICIFCLCTTIVSATNYSEDLIPLMTSNITPSGETISSLSRAGFDSYLAFDNSFIFTNTWISYNKDPYPHYIGYKFENQTKIQKYRLYQYWAPTLADYSYGTTPKSWIFQGSNDGVSWTNLDIQSNQINWPNATSIPKSYEFVNTNLYYYYRLLISSNNGYAQNFTNVNEFEMMAVIPTAAFSASPTSAYINIPIQFTDESTDSTSWYWEFGDGSNSTSQNPTHSYSSTGSYTVNLTVTNTDGSDTETKTDYIFIGQIPVASFSATPLTASNGPLEVIFTDTSTGNIASWLWLFGDGSTSTAQNPVHTYYISGEMTVSLTVTNSLGTDTETKINYITVPSVMQRPKATATIAPVSTQAMQNIITALGGDTVYQPDQGMDWLGILNSSFSVYDEILTTNILLLILYGLPFVVMLILHGRIEIPLIIGILFGVIIIIQLPADFQPTAWAFIAIGIVGIFAKALIFKDRW